MRPMSDQTDKVYAPQSLNDRSGLTPAKSLRHSEIAAIRRFAAIHARNFIFQIRVSAIAQSPDCQITQKESSNQAGCGLNR